MELKRKADSVSSDSSSSPISTPSPQPPYGAGSADSSPQPKKIKLVIRKPKVDVVQMVEESLILGHGVQPNFAKVDWVAPGGGCRPGKGQGLEEISPRSMTFCGGR